jgi:choline dehydrogenase-like flavoprotein
MTLGMLDDVEHDLLQARVCIIGAGAAGITLACELDAAGFQVLLIEAGGLNLDRGLTDYYGGTATAPHADPAQFRRAIFGGTTGLWGGRCVPFQPIDFETRDYVANSGWPIAYEDLARHYPRALEYCDAGAFDFTASGSVKPFAQTIEGFDGEDAVITDRIERYSLPTDFGRRYRDKIRQSTNITALLGARCLRLVKAAGADRIDGAELVDRAGRKRMVSAQVVVLATGGVEVPRLLMLSDQQGAGFGNRGDALGRYYMCHFENTAGSLVPLGARVVFNFERTTDGVYCRRQLRFRPEAQRHHRLLNTVFRLHFPSYSDASHGSSVMSTIFLAKSVLVPEYRNILQHGAEAPASPTLQHVRNVVTGLPQLAKFASDWLFRIQLARRKLPYTLVPNADGSFPVDFNSEQTPLASNRVTLSDDVDRHGLRRVHIAWRLSAEDIDSAHRAFQLLRETLNRSGRARLGFDEQHLRERISRSVPLGGHHIGTARMAASERMGVVDTNCAVFGLPNLYIASSAVFPTSSDANPTLSIAALAIRLAGHLRSTLA